MIVGIVIGVLPVLLFLGALVFLDSYKLVTFRSVSIVILVGCVCGLCAYLINSAILLLAKPDAEFFRRYAAPVIEEALKASYIAVLLHSRRIGFLVDAGILGFAAGAGFAVVENIYYAQALGETLVVVWIVRGLGTAIMHGGTTAIFAVIGKTYLDREAAAKPLGYVPGFLIAVIIHSLFNHFFLAPIFSALLVLVLVPAVLFIAFARSEKALQSWLGVGFDTDQELLQSITSGNIRSTHVGEYLQSLRAHFKPEDVIDMLCMLRIHLELSIQAKGILLMREAGFDVPADPATQEKFEELRALERNIGATGKLAIMPFLHTSARDLWELYMLKSR